MKKKQKKKQKGQPKSHSPTKTMQAESLMAVQEKLGLFTFRKKRTKSKEVLKDKPLSFI